MGFHDEPIGDGILEQLDILDGGGGVGGGGGGEEEGGSDAVRPTYLSCYYSVCN